MTEATSASPRPELAAHAERPGLGWTELNGERLFRVSGDAPRKFLDGQLSQNVDDITDSQSRRAAACNPKGRAYALMQLAAIGDDVLVQMPSSIADDVMAHLNKFLMLFRKTEMTALSQARVFGLWGQETASRIDAKADTLSQSGDSLTLCHEDAAYGKLIRVMDTAEGCARFEYWHLTAEADIPVPGSDAFRPDQKHTEADWAAAEISAGVVQLSSGSVDSYIPQMLNWQHVDGIHFKKGCYTGQEVIARMYFLGQLKKSVFRLRSENMSDAPETGTGIFANGKTVGEVINAVCFDNGQWEMLAVIKHSALDHTPWRMGSSDGETLERKPLPYDVPEQTKKS